MEAGTARLKCLAQGPNTLFLARVQTRSAKSRDKCTNNAASISIKAKPDKKQKQARLFLLHMCKQWCALNNNKLKVIFSEQLCIHLQQQTMRQRGFGMEVTADGSDMTDSPSRSQGSQLQCPNCRKYFPHDLLENHMRDCTGDDWMAYIGRRMIRFSDCYGPGWNLGISRWWFLLTTDQTDVHKLIMVT